MHNGKHKFKHADSGVFEFSWMTYTGCSVQFLCRFSLQTFDFCRNISSLKILFPHLKEHWKTKQTMYNALNGNQHHSITITSDTTNANPTCAISRMLAIAGLMLLVVLVGGVGQAHCRLLGWSRRHEDGGAVLEGWGNARHSSVIRQTCRLAVNKWNSRPRLSVANIRFWYTSDTEALFTCGYLRCGTFGVGVRQLARGRNSPTLTKIFKYLHASFPFECTSSCLDYEQSIIQNECFSANVTDHLNYGRYFSALAHRHSKSISYI